MSQIFQTRRLTIRNLFLGDLEAFNDLQCNVAVMRYITGRAMTPEESEASLHRYLSKYEEADNVFRVWAIQRRSDQAFIGTCALITMEGTTENDLGYRIREKYWRNGYATEVAQGLIQYAFKVLHLPFLRADADVENLGSIKILDRTMNFVKEVPYPDEGCTAKQYLLVNSER